MSVSENRVDPSHEWLYEAYSAFLERNHSRVCSFHSFKSHGFASRGPLLHRFQITLILAPQFLQRHSSTSSCGSGNETHLASLDAIYDLFDKRCVLHTLNKTEIAHIKSMQTQHAYDVYIYMHIKYVGVCICGGIVQLSKIEALQLTEDSVSQHKKVESK